MTSLRESRERERDRRKKARLEKYAEKGVDRAIKALEKLKAKEITEVVEGDEKPLQKQSVKKKTTKKGDKK